MPHIGGFELVIILLAAVVFFGAAKIPQLGNSLGLGIKNFKKALSGEEIDVSPKVKKKKDSPALESKTQAEEEDEEEEEEPAAARKP